MRKKIILILIIIILFLFWIIFKNTKTNSNQKQDIILFNWSEYIEPSIIHNFNKNSNKFNVKQIFLSSNELAINKIKSGNKYDIAILSEYAIEQLKDDYLEQIQTKYIIPPFTESFQKIKDIKKEDKIWSYTIPYFWGKLGLLYRKDKFGDKLNEPTFSQNLEEIIKNSDYKIALYNTPFEVIFLGLKITGGDISVNSKNSEEDINKAKQFLLSLKKENNNLSFITDQLLDRMKIKGQEYYDIAVAYSGDARYLMKQNNNLGYYQFNSEKVGNKKGTNVWFDGLVLPKGTNKEGAYEFIDFLLKSRNNIKQNMDFIGYNSPYMDFNDGEIKLEINDGDKMFKYNKEYKKQINDAWNEVYAYPISEDKYLIILSFIILLFFSYIFFFKK